MENTSNRYYYLFIFSLYCFLNAQFLFSNNSNDEEAERRQKHLKEIEESIKKENYSSTDWGLAKPFHEYHDIVMNPEKIVQAEQRFYSRAVGTIRGDWTKANSLKALAPRNQSADDSWYKAVLDSEQGYIILETQDIFPKPQLSEDLNFIQGFLTVYSDIAESESAFLRVEGVHVINNGSIFLHGYQASRNYTPINLLRLLPAESLFTTLHKFYSEHFSSRLDFFEGASSSFLPSDETCWVQVLLQLEPFDSSVTVQDIKRLESELQDPQGYSTISPIPLVSDMMIYSPNCPNVALFGTKITGNKTEVIHNKLVHYSIFALIMGLISCLSIILQIEYSVTPSMVSKVSWPSLGLHMVLDGYLSLAHFTGAVFFSQIRTSFLATTFFFVVALSLFETRFLQLLFRVQQPQASASSQRQSMGLLNIIFYALMLCGLPLVWQTLSSRGTTQRVVLWSSLFILYSFWLPQIWRNIIRGTSKGLSYVYIAGMSVSKLFFPVYLFLCPYNFIGLKGEPYLAISLSTYVVLQIIFLYSQDKFGSRWMIPMAVFPSAYDYYQRPAAPNEEAPLDPSCSDCAICMVSLVDDTTSTSNPNSSINPNDPLLNHAQPSQSSASSTFKRLTSRDIMITPCSHVFHSTCLEQWMKIKLECPVCRSLLPPN